MYVTSSEGNIQAASAGDRNGGIARVPQSQLVARDTPAVRPPPLTHTASTQPNVLQRCDIILTCVRLCPH